MRGLWGLHISIKLQFRELSSMLGRLSGCTAVFQISLILVTSPYPCSCDRNKSLSVWILVQSVTGSISGVSRSVCVASPQEKSVTRQMSKPGLEARFSSLASSPVLDAMLTPDRWQHNVCYSSYLWNSIFQRLTQKNEYTINYSVLNEIDQMACSIYYYIQF